MGCISADKLSSTPSRKHYSVFSEDQTHSDVLCARAEDLRFIRSSQRPDTFSDIWKETFFDFQIQSFDANWFLLWISISTKLYHINEILWRYVGIWGTQNMRTLKTKTFWRYRIGGAHFDLLWLENKLKSLLPWQVWCISVCSHLFSAEFIL